MRPLACGLLALLVFGCTDATVERGPEISPDALVTEAPDTPPVASMPGDTMPVETATTALEIHFLDVGQGDAVLLRSGGKDALIDAGPADRIVRMLREIGVDTLDLLLASHNHADHIGGADAVLDSMPVRFYLDNGHPASTRIQARVLERVERKGITYLRPERRTITLGNARLRILPPPDEVEGDEQNNRSVGVIVEIGSFEALLTGDSETEELSIFLSRDTLPDIEVLKAPHHGSRNGVTPAFLARTRPEVVVISLGEDNGYGHPHAAAVRYYCAGGRRVFRTDRSGEVVIRVTAEGEYEVHARNEGAAPAC